MNTFKDAIYGKRKEIVILFRKHMKNRIKFMKLIVYGDKWLIASLVSCSFAQPFDGKADEKVVIN